MTDEQRKRLEAELWNVANTLRGKMNADEFRDYILGFIFYKYLSERLHSYADEILKFDDILFHEIDENSDQGKEILAAIKHETINALGYFLKPSELFSALAKRGQKPGQHIIEDLAKILKNIERSTLGTEAEDDFDGLFYEVDLTNPKLGRTDNEKNSVITKVLSHLDKIDFGLDNADSDILGDAYEYLIKQFASGAGKKAGEFYTPPEVSTVIAKIVATDKTSLKSVYDPTCGSGSLLLRIGREVDKVGDYYGQESNRTTYNLARMNMILHGVHYRDFDIEQDDTLERPRHLDQKFEAVVANPPFSAKWSANKLFETNDRFSQYGRIAPASKADYAFVQHMLYQLDDNGTMAVILPHGALFRGAAEGVIREYIIKDQNWLDAVIGLPANIFYGTSIPACILVFRKCRETEDVIFIDASDDFERGKNQNKLRPEDIDKIVDTYRKRQTIDKYSEVVTRAQIAENDYNLNIPRYVDKFEPEPEVDLSAVVSELEAVRESMKPMDDDIRGFCDELGIKSPV